jgi:hypothetical protein
VIDEEFLLRNFFDCKVCIGYVDMRKIYLISYRRNYTYIDKERQGEEKRKEK